MLTPTGSPHGRGVPGHTLGSLWAHDGAWRPRVLVAEDDDAMRFLIVQTLVREGFAVTEARDGIELLALAESARRDDGTGPELVLTDVRMPGCSGIEALGRLRLTLRGSAILVITAFSDEALRNAARDAGAAAVLDKFQEEIAELRAELPGADPARLADEMGDLLFVAANLARKLGLDPEACLRQASAKFTRRFVGVEAVLAAEGLTPGDATLAQMEAHWAAVKRGEPVIASEAKQSIARHNGLIDCFVATLLAMTRYYSAWLDSLRYA